LHENCTETHFIVDTSQWLEPARAQVRAILAAIATMPKQRESCAPTDFSAPSGGMPAAGLAAPYLPVAGISLPVAIAAGQSNLHFKECDYVDTC
jgi:hypothetical protein